MQWNTWIYIKVYSFTARFSVLLLWAYLPIYTYGQIIKGKTKDHVTYDLIMWYSAAEVDNVFILQKRSIQAIYGMKTRKSFQGFFFLKLILEHCSPNTYLILFNWLKKKAEVLCSTVYSPISLSIVDRYTKYFFFSKEYTSEVVPLEPSQDLTVESGEIEGNAQILRARTMLFTYFYLK